MGAGYIGVELAEAFQRKGKEVTLIDVADTCLAGYYDEDLSAIMANNLQAHGIKLAFGETVREVVGKTKVERIITDKASYNVDMVILAVGFRPNTSLAAGKVELFKNGAFLVDKNKKQVSLAFMQLVIVQLFITMLLAKRTISPLLQMQ